MGSAVVAYTDPQGYFSRHESLIEQNLQLLTNIHWRPQAYAFDQALPNLNDINTTTRTVPSLKIQLVPEGGNRQKQHQIPGLNNAPLVQILVIETAPLDIYRSKLRQIGKDWFHNQVEVREPTGYVVIHAKTPNDSSKNSRAIWSRLIAEFEPANCVQLSSADKNTWADLRNLIQAQLTFAFDARISMLESEIKKLEATREIPGWNFGSLFAVHESLAWAYESMSLLDDAIKVYNGLDSMVSVMVDHEWAEIPQTANLTLLGDRDALIDPILSQTASQFDVQRHLVSRKASLYLEVARSKRQKEESVDSLADQFVLESICLVLSKIPLLMQTLSKEFGEWDSNLWLLKSVRQFYELITEIGSSKLSRGKGDLILLERDAIQKLGALSGWNIPGVFNEISLDLGDDSKVDDKSARSNFEIRSEAELREKFIYLTQQATLYHRIANHSRTVRHLTTQLLMIEYHQAHFEKAWEILQNNPSLLQQTSHPPFSISLLSVSLDCAESLGHEEHVNELAWRLIGFNDVPLETFQKTVSRIQRLEKSKPMTFNLSIWFKPKLIPYLRGDEKGYYYELELVAKRPEYPFVSLDSVSLLGTVLDEINGAERPVLFESSDLANKKLIKLYTKTFKEGIVRLNRLEVHHGSVTLVHDLNALLSAMHPLSNAFTANVVLAKHHTMKKRDIELRLKSPCEISGAKVIMQSMDSHSQLLWDKAEGGNNLTHFTEAIIKLPILIDSEHSRCNIKVVVEYDRKSYEFLKTLDFSLAVSVDFQEFFRQPPRILSQFFVKPFSNAPAIFTNATLVANQSYTVETISAMCGNTYIAYNNAPISYIFSIAKRGEVDPKLPPSMQLNVTYRSMLWESQKILYGACMSKIENTELDSYKPLVCNIIERLCTFCDMAQYLSKGLVKLRDGSQVSAEIAEALRFIDPQHSKKLQTLISSLFSKGVAKDPDLDFEELNSTMALDVPDPDAEVVHYVELNLEDKDSQSMHKAFKKYTVGSVINAYLKIETISFQNQDLSEKFFEYELDRLSEGWSYTGKVKGIFRGSEKVNETLNLIPNRSLELQIPNVAVRSISQIEHTDDESDSVRSRVTREFDNTVIAAKHANNKILVVPDVNMLAITF